MAITVTIQDQQDSHTFDVVIVPLTITPIIRETDVETMDGNIATYYSSTKRQVQLELGYLTSSEYDILKGFETRQYHNLKYPTITINGAPSVAVSGMTAKITVSSRQIVNNCGEVRKVTVSFRESKQMA